jgi:glyoxylase-like metal-dependent hydrolase (beta-lactamase superfamily II)
MFWLFIRPVDSLEGAPINCEVNDGELLPIAGGLKAIHTPGHSAGHLAFLWPREGVLFVGDACGNFPSFGWSLGYEDLQVGRQSLAKLAQLDFQIACFGHGRAFQQDASQRFRKRWL